MTPTPYRYCCLFLIGLIACSTSSADESGTSAAEIYQRRIVPLLRSEQASSCTECHFSHVELKDYLSEDPAETFAALRQAGLIDVNHPDHSKLLRFIARKPDSSNPLIEKVRQQEYTALKAWIQAAVKDPALLRARSRKRLGTELPLEVIRHARRDRVLKSFIDNIWSEIGRCVNCHSPELNRNKIKRFGKEYVDGISWVIPHDPAATLERLVEDGDIDLDNPEQSMLLTKPAGLEDHGGGPKFLVGSPSYKKFLAFLTDYAAIRQGAYRAATDLPQPPDLLFLPTKQFLRITNLPENLGKRAPLQVDLFRWNRKTRHWDPEPIASLFGPVNAKDHLFMGMADLLVPADSPHLKEIRKHPRIPPGPLLGKVYIDRKGRTARDPEFRLNTTRPVAQFEIQGPWPDGFRKPYVVRFRPISQQD